MSNENTTTPEPQRPAPLPPVTGSASDYNPAQCLRAEVERFKATNRFTPMDVTGFYIQAAVVLDEHRRMVEALKLFRDCTGSFGEDIRRIAGRALPMSETARTSQAAGYAKTKCGA